MENRSAVLYKLFDVMVRSYLNKAFINARYLKSINEIILFERDRKTQIQKKCIK